MVGRIENYSELWEQADWKQFQKVLFRLQHRVWKAVRTGDMAKAKAKIFGSWMLGNAHVQIS
jgi:hypothetical protein